jgi:putative two-component system response regulator
MPTLAGRILVADDDTLNSTLLTVSLEEEGYAVEAAADGQAALDRLHARPFDILLLDLLMPEVDGYQVLAHLKADPELRHLPVIVISAAEEQDSIVKCIELGAEDYLLKPFNRVMLKARVDASMEKKRLRDQEQVYRRQIEEYNLHLERRVQDQVAEIASAQLATILALAKLSESRDLETGRHLERVREYCKILLERLRQRPQYQALINSTYIDYLYLASMLHDIGKVGVPDIILLKSGRLTPEEYAVMKTHTRIGADTLKEVNRQFPGNNFIRIGIEVAESHHEKWDGSGYPHGLAGELIPLPGRVLALADVYDAMTSRRVYKDALSHEQSVAVIREERGRYFDPNVVDCFLEAQDEFLAIRARYEDI